MIFTQPGILISGFFMDVTINDLFATIYPHRDEYIQDEDKIHLSKKGIGACSKQVADIIKSIKAK